MKYLVRLEGRTWEIAVDGGRVTVDGKEHQAELRAVEGTPLQLLTLDGRSWPLAMESGGRGAWTVLCDGEDREVEVLDERAAHIRSLASSGAPPASPVTLKAPMPGLVVQVLAEPGQKVVEGTSLIVLEAMKMENELKAGTQGVVESVSVSRGQTVEKGQVLLTFAATAQ